MAAGTKPATLGAASLTTGVFLAGFAGAFAYADEAATPGDQNADSADHIVGRFGSEESWATKGEGSADADDELARQPGASSRARVRAPMEVGPCVAVDAAANGSRQITTQQVTYYPLAAGTYSSSSGFGFRIHPILGTATMHNGDDYAAPAGTPIHSVADGVVRVASIGPTQGHYVVIEHHDEVRGTYTSHYFHQIAGSIQVSPGQKVSAGQTIGAVGSTGRSTGAHLHLEIHDSSDTPVSPSSWLANAGAVSVGQECS